MALDVTEGKKLENIMVDEEEQEIVEALERYLSRRSLVQPHPLLQWVMW
ncbi:MAG: hypothetical protein J0H12_05530 [Candidatus Paracaedimonas acanthamoebae]|uniref:Uncharacterized protein n=1 Tax=Candidatus Paracaedimonas acanthamoebae TaxID=244581 RepID=A0A8J7PT74_9PROT|nr:hypothetical protein [Candidatus Paracaedimonas acanthamoebae]